MLLFYESLSVFPLDRGLFAVPVIGRTRCVCWGGGIKIRCSLVGWHAPQHVLEPTFPHGNSPPSFNPSCAVCLQRVHQRRLLQLHAPETHIAGTSKGVVRPPQEKV